MKKTTDKKFMQLTTRFVPYSFRSRIEEVKNGVRVIQPKDIKNDDIQWDTVTATDLGAKKAPEPLLNGDLLILSRGLKQQALVFKSDDSKRYTICSNMYHHYRVKCDDINPYYLAFLLNHSNKIKNQIEVASASSSMTVKVYSRQSIEDLDIPVPPRKEQDAIVALHDNIKQQQQCYQELMDNNQAMLSGVANKLTK